MPRPSIRRANTKKRKFGASADAMAPKIMMAATVVYTTLRPKTSAILPNTKAPTKAPRMAVPVTQLV